MDWIEHVVDGVVRLGPIGVIAVLATACLGIAWKALCVLECTLNGRDKK